MSTNCLQCAKEFSFYPSQKRRFCSISCSLIGNRRWNPSSLNTPGKKKQEKELSERNQGAGNYFYGKKGESSPNWKGGKYLSQAGYVMVSRYRQKPISLHRLLIEKQLSRKLTKNEHIHHIDGNPLNNTLGNLELLTKAEHISLHTTIRNKRMLRDAHGRFKCLRSD